MNAPFEPKDGDFQALAEQLSSSSKTLSALRSVNRQGAFVQDAANPLSSGQKKATADMLNNASDTKFSTAGAVFNDRRAAGRKTSGFGRNTLNTNSAKIRQNESVSSRSASSADTGGKKTKKPYMPMVGRILLSVIPGIMIAQLFLNFLLVPLVDALGFEFVYLYSYEEVQRTLSILIGALFFALSFLVFSPTKEDKK